MDNNLQTPCPGCGVTDGRPHLNACEAGEDGRMASPMSGEAATTIATGFDMEPLADGNLLIEFSRTLP